VSRELQHHCRRGFGALAQPQQTGAFTRDFRTSNAATGSAYWADYQPDYCSARPTGAETGGASHAEGGRGGGERQVVTLADGRARKRKRSRDKGTWDYKRSTIGGRRSGVSGFSSLHHALYLPPASTATARNGDMPRAHTQSLAGPNGKSSAGSYSDNDEDNEDNDDDRCL